VPKIPSMRCDLPLPWPDRRPLDTAREDHPPCSCDCPTLPSTGMIRFLRLLAMSNADTDIEILVLRHQLTVLQRRVNKPRLTLPDRAFLAALLLKLPRSTLRGRPLIVSPDTVLRWHRDLLRRRHTRISRPQRPGRRPTAGSIRALVLRLARDNPGGGYRSIHGELAIVGITITPSTVWEILTTHGIPPAPDRDRPTWAGFLRSQAHALLAADVVATHTLTGTRLFVLAVLEHTTRRIRILGATAHPSAAGTTQRARTLVMDLQDAHASVRYLIRDRDSNYTAAFDAVLAEGGITTIMTGIRLPRMNAIMQRWIRTCRAELLDRNPHPEPGPPAARPRRIRSVLPRPPDTPRPAERSSPSPTSPTDHKSDRTGPAHHPTTRSTRQHPSRVSPCRLTSPDEVFGTYRVPGGNR
jgi:putative transposase